jgi:drug/metabolite transporter (DMT)-like permease
MSKLEFYISMIVCFVMFVSLILVYTFALPKDSDQSSKLVAVVGTFSVAVAITAYFIAARHFSGDPSTMLQFILAITFLLMAGSIISVGISTAQLTGLRDTLASKTTTTA